MKISKVARTPPAQIERDELNRFLEQLLEPARFKDYCPNGLQVEGTKKIRHIVTGVTASQALLRAAIKLGADTVLVHHGYFWRGEDPCLTGAKRARLGLLMAHNINLFAYHLPLDLHPELGNNAQLGRIMGWPIERTTGEQGLVAINDLPKPISLSTLTRRLKSKLMRQPLAVGQLQRPIRRVAWCTGGAQDYLEAAIAAGADVFISGEISERTTHIAREAGVIYLAAGHHATERFGVAALGEHIEERFGVKVRFVDDPNPV